MLQNHKWQRTSRCTAASSVANRRGPPRSRLSTSPALKRLVSTARERLRMPGMSMPSSAASGVCHQGGLGGEGDRQVKQSKELPSRTRQGQHVTQSAFPWSRMRSPSDLDSFVAGSLVA